MTQTALLITRPYESALRFQGRLSQDIQDSVKIVVSPLLEIAPTGVQPDVAAFEAVIFTSANAVTLMPEGQDKPAYCVGAVTAERAAAGWRVLATELNADDLIARIIMVGPKGPLLHLAGRHRRGDIAERLSESGIKTDVQILYSQELLPLTAPARALFDEGRSVVVPLFSPRSAVQFVEQAPDLRATTIVCISDAVARCVEGSGAASIGIVDAPTGVEMLRRVEKVLRGTSLA